MLRYHRGISRDATGNFIPLAYVHAYLPGTQTYVAIYSDEAGATALQQPIRSDAQGIYQFYTREPVIDLRYVLPLVPTGYAYKVPLQVRQTPFVVNVDSYGATGDGLTDDRAAVQSAVDAATAIGPGSIVRFTPGRTYAIVGEILGQETLIIDLTGAKIAHKATAYGKGLFRFRPPQQFAIAWPYDIEANSREWLEQDPPYSQGDYLLFTTNYHWIDRQYKYGNTHYGQAFLVERVHQGTVTLSDFFVQGMRAADGIELRSFKSISPVIRGGEIQTDDSQASGGVEPEPAVSYCIRFCHCVYPRIEGTRLNGLAFQYSTYVRFEHCFGPVADGLKLFAAILPGSSTDGVYGLSFGGATAHGKLLNSEGHGLRHMADVSWSDLEDGDGELILGRICGVFWSLVKGCRAYDSVSTGFGPHGCGRYIDFVDCQDFNGGGFSTRVSYTRFINCSAFHAFRDNGPAFSFGHGVQLDTNAQGQWPPNPPPPDPEGSAYGGQNPLVGCELLNCSQGGYRDGLFRVCNMSTLTVRDCNVVLPHREQAIANGTEPYYRRWGFFQFSNPRLWEEGLPNSPQRYLAGDWIRDLWLDGSVWKYALYECKQAHAASAQNRPATWVEQNNGETAYWRRIDGMAGRPSPLRGEIVIQRCRFIHEDSCWRWNGLHPEWAIFGPVVYPVSMTLEDVEFSPSIAMDEYNEHCGAYVRAFIISVRDCRCQLGGSSAQKYAIRLLLPGSKEDDVMFIDGAVADAAIEFSGCRLQGTTAPWEINPGSTGGYSLIAANIATAGDLELSGGLTTGGDVASGGDVAAQGRVFAGQGFAYGSSVLPPTPGADVGCIPLHDESGSVLGYIRLYSS